MTALLQPRSQSILPLEAGDHLTRFEFHRRYEAMPNLKKAELLEGIVYIPTYLGSLVYHAEPLSNLLGWLGYYGAYTAGTRSGSNCSVILDEDNEPQPDAVLFLARSKQVKLDSEGFMHGPPELIGETASSSSTYDLGVKKHVYRRSGVREYVVHRVRDSALDWFVLNEGNYDVVAPNAEGIIQSHQFPGLWLNVPAFLAGDLKTVLETLQRGLATPEHAAFVERLAEPRPPA